MVNDELVTLFGFGHTAKTRQKYSSVMIPHSRNDPLPKKFKTTTKVESYAPVNVLDCEIELEELQIASPRNDLASVYLMMITLLLNENYSAFESFDSDSDEDELIRGGDSFES